MNTMWARLPAPTIVHKHMMSMSERYMAMDEDATTSGTNRTPDHDSSPPRQALHDGDSSVDSSSRRGGGIIGRQFPALRKSSPDRGYRGAGGEGDDGGGGNPPLHKQGRRNDDAQGKKKHQQFLRKITNLPTKVGGGGPPRPCPSNDTEDTAATTAEGGCGASCANEGDVPPRPGLGTAPGPGGGLARMASSRTLNSRRGGDGGPPDLDAVTASAAPDRRGGSRPSRRRKNNPPVPNTWYYSSNHILINEERARRNLPTLCRSSDLDDEARIVANAMAERGRVLRSDMNYLAHKIRSKRGDAGLGAGGGAAVAVVLGENVGSGRSIREVHAKFMKSPRDRSNMLDGRFREMGIGAVRRGTVTGERLAGGAAAGGGVDDPSAEVLFVCQLFKG